MENLVNYQEQHWTKPSLLDTFLECYLRLQNFPKLQNSQDWLFKMREYRYALKY